MLKMQKKVSLSHLDINIAISKLYGVMFISIIIITFSAILTSVRPCVGMDSFMFSHKVASLKVFRTEGTLKRTFACVSYPSM